VPTLDVVPANQFVGPVLVRVLVKRQIERDLGVVDPLRPVLQQPQSFIRGLCHLQPLPVLRVKPRRFIQDV